MLTAVPRSRTLDHEVDTPLTSSPPSPSGNLLPNHPMRQHLYLPPQHDSKKKRRRRGGGGGGERGRGGERKRKEKREKRKKEKKKARVQIRALTDKSNHQPTPDLANILRHEPDRRAHLPRNADRQLSIHVCVLIRLPRRHEFVIHIAALHAIEDVEQKHAGADGLVLEAANGAAPAAFGGLFVGPLDHLRVRDFALAETLRQRGERFRDVAAHQLPHQAEGEGALAVGDVGALNADEGEAHLLSQLDGVVGVLDRFEAHQFPTRRWGLVDMAPVDAAGDNFVVGLQEDSAVTEVVEQGVDGWSHIQGVEPQCEDTGFALPFSVKVLDLGFFFFRDGVQAGMRVEKIGDKGKVQFRVAGHQGGGGEEFAAFELVGVVQDFFGSLKEITGLQGRTAAEFGCELI